jgi:fructokinase
MRNGVISMGEALIDFLPLDDMNETYQKCPGGAPANVAVGVARLGARVAFLGKVGNDVLGHFLKNTLKDYNVTIDSMYMSNDIRTGVVFVTLAEDGEREFTFYINPSADRFLHEAEIKRDFIRDYKILHFGSISLIGEPSRSATKKAVRIAKEEGLIISYDPNLRLNLWSSKEEAKETIIPMLSEVDVLKISEEELAFITGYDEHEAGIKWLSQFDISIMVITYGSKGSFIHTKHGTSIQVPAIKVKAVDTTGAGDAYVSGVLYCLNELINNNLSELSKVELEHIAKFASVSGGLAASKKGAMTALPKLDEVNEKLKGIWG